MVAHFDMESVMLQHHGESACQSLCENALSGFKLQIKVQNAFSDSITVPDYLRERGPILISLGNFGVTLEV